MYQQELDFRKRDVDLEEQKDDALVYYIKKCIQLEEKVIQLETELLDLKRGEYDEEER